MLVEVGGKNYEVSGLMWGQLPAWKLIKVDGRPMTGPEFEALPLADKQALFEHVKQHLASLNTARPTL